MNRFSKPKIFNTRSPAQDFTSQAPSGPFDSYRDKRPHNSDIKELERLLGYEFNDSSILRLALTHRSVRSRFPLPTSDHLESNERLEFLGDSVLGAEMATILFSSDGKLTEGEMTRVKSALVRNEMLAEKARDMFLLDTFITVDQRERKINILSLEGPMADAMEAIIGAISLDGTKGDVRSFICRMYASEFGSDLRLLSGMDPKSELVLFAKTNRWGEVKYSVNVAKNAAGPHYMATAYTLRRGRKRTIGKGEGPSRRRAEASAAENAMEPLRLNKPNKLAGKPVAVVSFRTVEQADADWWVKLKRLFKIKS